MCYRKFVEARAYLRRPVESIVLRQTCSDETVDKRLRGRAPWPEGKLDGSAVPARSIIRLNNQASILNPAQIGSIAEKLHLGMPRDAHES